MVRARSGRAGPEPRAVEHPVSRGRPISQFLHRPEVQDHEKLAAQLSARLDELASAFATKREIPVDLVALCQELGVGLRIKLADGARRGALMRRGDSWEVVLMRRDARPAPISGHERFTIAHELGHYLLLEDTRFQPQRDAEYWLGEALCNHFASRLLIPPCLLADISEPMSTAELVATVNAVAQRALVTPEPAARAVVAHLVTPIALGTFRLDPWTTTRRLGFRGWWAENRSWWGGRGGRRLAVYADHALAPVLQTMRRMSPGQTATPELAGATTTFLRRRGGPTASFAALLA